MSYLNKNKVIYLNFI